MCIRDRSQTAEQQANDEKAGGEPLPRTSAKKASVPSVHRDKAPQAALAVEIFFEFLPGAEEGQALGLHGNLFAGAGIEMCIRDSIKVVKDAESAKATAKALFESEHNVRMLLVEEAVDIEREIYLSVTVDLSLIHI